jgi:hypothetical protein
LWCSAFNIVQPPTPLYAPYITVQTMLATYTFFRRSTNTVETLLSILQPRPGEAKEKFKRARKKEKNPVLLIQRVSQAQLGFGLAPLVPAKASASARGYGDPLRHVQHPMESSRAARGAYGGLLGERFGESPPPRHSASCGCTDWPMRARHRLPVG